MENFATMDHRVNGKIYSETLLTTKTNTEKIKKEMLTKIQDYFKIDTVDIVKFHIEYGQK